MEAFNVDNYVRRGKTIVLTLRPDQEEQGRQWGDTDTSLLLALMRYNIDEFHNQRRKKKDVWTDIAHALNVDNYLWGPEDCRKKWSNMIRTFKTIIESKNEQKRVRWSSYDAMWKIFSHPSAKYLPESTSIMSVLGDIQMNPLESLHEEDGPTIRIRTVSTSSVNPEHYSTNSDSITLLPTSSITESDEPINHESDSEQQQAEQDQGGGSANNELANFIASEVIDSDYIREAEDIEITSQPMVGTSEDQDQAQILSEAPEGEGQDEVFTVHLSTENLTAGTAPSTQFQIPTSNRKRKLNSRQRSNEAQESLTEQFIAITKEQNERVLALMAKFHEETIETMRERNSILRDLSESLKHEMSS